MKFKWLATMLVSILFMCNVVVLFAVDKAQWRNIYSGNPSSPQAATYIFLCTKMGDDIKLGNRAGEPEGCRMKCERDCCGPNGCCDCCGKDKCGLFLAAVTVDESFGEFVGFSEATRGVIWSASIDFRKLSAGCCGSSETALVFRTAYNMSHYAPEAVSAHYQRGYRDEFCLVSQYGEYRLADKRREYLHYVKAGGVCSLVNDPADYHDSGGIQYILRRALFRWKYREALSIGKFLELIGEIGKIDNESGYLMAPKSYGFWGLWSNGYNCVEFCESFLTSCGLVRKRTGWFLGHKREDLLKHILLSEKMSGFCVIAHNVHEFVQPPEMSYNNFLLKNSVETARCSAVVFQDKVVFFISDFE